MEALQEIHTVIHERLSCELSILPLMAAVLSRQIKNQENLVANMSYLSHKNL